MSYIRIRKHYLHVPYLALGLLEFLVLFLSFYVLSEIQQALDLVPVSYSLWSSLLYASLLSAGSLAMGVYLAMMREGFAAMFFRTLVAFCFLGSLGLSVVTVIWPALDVGSSNLFWAVMISTGITLLVRRAFVHLVDSDQLSRRILVLGTGQLASQIHREYERYRRSLGVRILGYLGSEEEALPAHACMPTPDDLFTFCKNNRISEIVVATQERRRTEGAQFPLDDLIRCKLGGVQISSAQAFYERELNRIDLTLLQPSWIIFSDGFKASKARDAIKRLFDLVVSVTLAILLAPIMFFVFAAVYLESGRPFVYSQIRTGQHGKPFKIYKVRSMRQDAEKDGKAVWAKAQDSRVTRVGAFIRNTRLDEIPQLYNVIRGDMSFVGPRPERPEFVVDLENSIPFYTHRHAVKPGLMGWAQLNYPYGASVEDARCKLEYDLYYAKNHSFVMDILIMIQTVEVVLLGKGVH